MIGFFKYLKGYLRIKVWGFSPERFMNLCSNRDIFLWDIEKDGEIYFMNISIQGFYKLRPIVRKAGTRVAILQRYGLPFFIPVLKKKKIFLAGMFLTVAFWIVSSFFVWNIELYGNYQITKDMFGRFLKEQEVTVGKRKKQIDIGALEKEIRKNFPQVIWTSGKFTGTRLQIYIKENDTPMMEETIDNVEKGSSLVSEYDGTIISMIVRKGVPMVAIGDSVEKGQLLVDGKVPVFNEDATVREYQLVNADADIVLEHKRSFHASLPYDYVRKEYTDRIRKRYFIRIGQKEWRMPMERPFLIYDSLRRESRPLFFAKLSIPVYFGTYLYREYRNAEHEYTLDEARELLDKKLLLFIESLAEKGVQIIEKNVKIDTNNGMWVIDGSFLVQEAVGKSVENEFDFNEDGDVN